MSPFVPHREPCMDALVHWYRRPAPPLAVVVAGRIVASCTSPEAAAAVRRLMGVERPATAR